MLPLQAEESQRFPEIWHDLHISEVTSSQKTHLCCLSHTVGELCQP